MKLFLYRRLLGLAEIGVGFCHAFTPFDPYWDQDVLNIIIRLTNEIRP